MNTNFKCQNFLVFVLYNLLVVFIISTLALTTVEQETAECVDQTVRNNPELISRFNNGSIKISCEKKVNWNKQYMDALRRSADPGLSSSAMLSKAQIDWVNQIWKCNDVKCACDLMDFCKKGSERKLGAPFSFKRQRRDGHRRRRKRQGDFQSVDDVLSDTMGRAVRKEIRMITNSERRRLWAALNRLKTERIDNMSKYDILIVYHTPEYAPDAHFCAAFLPYHRELLKSLEVAVRMVEPDAALPYWDTTLDEGLPDPKDSVLWTDDFFGNGYGDVTSGPFANWTTVSDARFGQLSQNYKIVRRLGEAPFGGLMRDRDIDTLLSKESFRRFSYCVDPFLELIHGASHMWVGGHMLELRISPNDPVFFIFHSFIDYIWEQWRQRSQSRWQRENDFVIDREACNTYCRGSEQMRPFPIRVTGGLSNSYTDQLFVFQPRPTCSPSVPNCGSEYLFCDTRRYKCVSKVKMWGNCRGYEGLDLCHQGQCVRGRCEPAPATLPPTLPPPPTWPPTPRQTQPPTTFPPAPVPITQPPGPPSPTVWTPITVLSYSSGQNARAYPLATIVTTDNDRNLKLYGRTADPNQVPYYSGSAFAQLTNPFSVNDMVEVTLEVFDANRRPCVSLCINNQLVYAPCQPRIRLNRNPDKGDNVPFTPNYDLAKFLNMNGNKRKPDKFLFFCNPFSDPTAAPIQTFPPTIPPPPVTAPPLPVPMTTLPSQIVTDQTSINIQNPNTNGGNNQVVNIVDVNDKGRPLASGGCVNNHRCCRVWTSVTECGRNVWMQTACQKDCNVCRSNTAETNDCLDTNWQCPLWAARNQCQTNSDWMEENCKYSCKVCGRSVGALRSACGPIPNQSNNNNNCIDKHNNCASWAQSDECRKNPSWMRENCARSCHVC